MNLKRVRVCAAGLDLDSVCPFNLERLVISFAKACGEFVLESAPRLGSTGTNTPWSPMSDVVLARWTRPNSSNNAIDLVLSADIPLVVVTSPGGQTRILKICCVPGGLADWLDSPRFKSIMNLDSAVDLNCNF